MNIKSSKTDPFRQGVTLYLGQTGVDLCPVAAMIDYLAGRGIASGLLFQFQDGFPLHRRQLGKKSIAIEGMVCVTKFPQTMNTIILAGQ